VLDFLRSRVRAIPPKVIAALERFGTAERVQS